MNWIVNLIANLIRLIIIAGLGMIAGVTVEALTQLFGPAIPRLLAILLLIVTIPGLVFIWKRIQVAWARVVVLVGGLAFIVMLISVFFY